MASIRILIAEDDPDICDLLRLTLQPPYECLIAHNGMEGLQMAYDGEPDLIISDIMMPVMDGHEFISRLRRDAKFNSTPVIFLSALGTREQIRKGYEMGATLYITKPIDPVRLRRNVDLFIDDHRVRPTEKTLTPAEIQDALPVPGTAPKPKTKSRRPEPSNRQTPPARGKKPGTVVKPDPPVPKDPGEESSGSGRVRLLIIEDDADAREVVVQALQKDYEILTARDGIEGIERAARYKPDIFIIDGMLPKMTGYQLIPILKKNRFFYRSPIVFISGKSRPSDRRHVERLGVNHFLAKPFEIEKLEEIIRIITAQKDFEIVQNRVPYRQAALETLQNYESHRGEQKKDSKDAASLPANLKSRSDAETPWRN